jgi:hypothetical protein
MSSNPRWKHSRSTVVFALALWCVVALASNGFSQHAPSLVVRSYDTIGVSLGTLQRAQATVRDLLGEAGITSTWRTCRTPSGPAARSADACSDTVAMSEIIVRIVATPRTIEDPDVLGYSHVDPYVRKGTLATVFADRVRALAPSLRVDEGTLLGRAIAHEVGHLLLGSLEHSDAGLMRGVWRTPGHQRSDWLFSSTEATRLRDGLSAREGLGALAIARLPHPQ